MDRVVTVSSWLPALESTAAPGGLTIGLSAAMRGKPGVWFGWDGGTGACDDDRVEVSVHDGVTYARISLPAAVRDGCHKGFAHRTLWPLLHGFLDGFAYRAEEHAAYQSLSGIFARRLLPLLQVDDLLWVHDFHLIPLGRALRRLDVRAPIGFFLHVPFPGFEVLRALPPFIDLMEALLAYDVVGFQTEIDQQAFLGAVEMLWGSEALRSDGSVMLEGRRIRTGTFPISVDVEAIAQAAEAGYHSELVRRMSEGLEDRRLIIGVDRLDYSKGILQRFEAYQHFLDSHPQSIGKVSYLQVSPLGSSDTQPFTVLRDVLEQSAGRTNGRFARADWTPIRYLNRTYPHDTLMGFLRAADVCLVTPLRDGMNLVAKEFVAAQDPADPGVLVLSDRAGAACELGAALLVNPYDTASMGSAIHTAVSMPLQERQARHEKLLGKLRKHDVHAWRSRFLQVLASSRPCERSSAARSFALARAH